MKRVLLITLSLVLALVGWSTVGAEDGFYVIPAMKGNYAPVPKTGANTAYDATDDAALQKGVAWPTPRFTDNGNGTVTDKLTGLIWLKNADYFGPKTWGDALGTIIYLESGNPPSLVDGSQAGDWRLPNLRELESLVDYSRSSPALPAGHPFLNVKSDYTLYWSSTTHSSIETIAWGVNFQDGVSWNEKENDGFVWCVRGGK